MKVAFRQQASDYDCVPSTLINGLCYLFSRKEFPPYIIHRVYKDCLDVESFRGTSGQAIQGIGFWLNNYREHSYKKFAVKSKYLCGHQVHVGKNSKVIQCIDSKGAVVLRIHMHRYLWHCILAIRYDDHWLYCYDPSPRVRKYLYGDDVQIIEPAGHQTPNLRIKRDWLELDPYHEETSSDRKYVFGSIEDRECLLLNRIHL
jgi:hypothetical protein